MSRYQTAIGTAAGLIARKGRQVQIQRTLKGEYDPITRQSADTVVTHGYDAVGLPPGRSAEFRIGSLEGRRVMEFHIARRGEAFEPLPGDILTWAGEPWKLFWSSTLDPAADGAIYTLAYGERG